MNQHSPPCPGDVLQNHPFEDIRRVIDRVATMRARNIRIALFAAMICRPNPQAPNSPTERAHYLEILARQIDIITGVCNTLSNGVPLEDTPPDLCNWIYSIAQQQPENLAMILRLKTLSVDLLRAVRTNSPDQHTVLARHFKLGRGGYFGAVTSICDGFWDDLAREHKSQLETARHAADQLAHRLARLQHIGKHVRLVSLNASVEAARAGDAGKGLMVVAHEFRSLAEEIQQLAKDAHDDVNEAYRTGN
ncbi:methyl-accepting chemotaxis protein [Sulfitobacter aestuariivivens]|uniref:Methyl-accepting transducer domain-containing protein n=1 Tax=Sulfitobacter aestuariivivens TaxID=2766981 RepID=A0A927D2C5_9RHOB|nr:methyl-accepting chemotaxis protein [Sulfitobacter aestuariivivens]MBD3663058.1 hypothetical protein [Sulfitobacter aestuariivivens]